MQFTLIFDHNFLTELMERFDPDLIWEAAAITAKHFDDRGGPPYTPALTHRSIDVGRKAIGSLSFMSVASSLTPSALESRCVSCVRSLRSWDGKMKYHYVDGYNTQAYLR